MSTLSTIRKGTFGRLTSTPTSRMTSTLGSKYVPSRNSLNFLRLFFALVVVLDHAYGLGHFGHSPSVGNTDIGSISVWGFFGISGFLIAGSAFNARVDDYLWHRFLRIFPAFWICLIVTAFIIGALSWFTHPARTHCEIGCYFSAPNGPFGYVYHDWLLRIDQSTISGTPFHVPEPTSWDGSLWTLFYESLCYLILGLIAVLGMLRRPLTVLALTIVIMAIEFFISLSHVYVSFDVGKMLSFVPLFLTGSLIYLYRDRIPDSGVLAAASFAIFMTGAFLPFGGPFTVFTGINNGAALFAPALAYPILWLGIHLPFHQVGSRNDYSYGIYIYAWPAQQLLAVWGFYRWGYIAFLGLGIAFTVPLAVASWWLVEKKALRLKVYRPVPALHRLLASSSD
jgi:peptidoglycan/LPS O-acetylase OafA/YrhL